MYAGSAGRRDFARDMVPYQVLITYLQLKLRLMVGTAGRRGFARGMVPNQALSSFYNLKFLEMVGTAGLELAASWSQTRRSTN